MIKEGYNRKSAFKIKLVPLNAPTERRLQTLAALGWLILATILGPMSLAIMVLLALTTYWAKYLFFVYVIWWYWDRETCETGGRRSSRVRGLKMWEYYRDYFPIKLVKTVDLAPNKNYLFASYPHGILSSGAFGAFATDALNFDKLFQGLTPYPCTLNVIFKLPVLREIALGLGLNSVSRKSLNWILGTPGTGRAALVVVGGAAEASYNKPGTYRILLEKRKGFCKISLQNGSPLVPVFTFGETDIYETVLAKKGSFLEALQGWIKKTTRVQPIFFFGRGIFNYSYGFLPRRAPLTVVVGKPIDVKKIENPTEEQINELHKKFKEGIVTLFNEEKIKYLEDPKTQLIID